MDKQTHILYLSPLFQTVMGCSLKLGGLLPDLYVVFKQVSLFQICSRTSSNRTCARVVGVASGVVRSLMHMTVPFLPGNQ